MPDIVTDRKSGAIKAETLAEEGRGQWVRDRLLDARPELRKEFKDYDGDGVVGNIEDFVRYYEQNSVDIERNIPFFKWVSKMDPHHRTIHNPIHDYLSLAYDVVPGSDVQELYGAMGSVVAEVRQLHGASSAKVITALLQQKFTSAQKGSLLILGAAYQFGLVEESGGLISVPNADGSYKDMTMGELYGEFYSDLARTSDKYGALDRARIGYSNAIDLDPSYQSRYFRLSSVLHEMEKYKQAIEVCDAALGNDPYDAIAMASRGFAFLALKNIRAARADFKESLQFDPTHAPAHVGLGRIKHVNKDYGGARKHYTGATIADPMNPLGYYWRAVAYDDERLPEKAILDFIRAIKRDRSSSAAFHGLALSQHDAGHLGYADNNFRAAAKRDPFNARIYKDLGYLRLDRKQPKGAMWAFNKALRLNPKLVAAFIGRGNVWHERANYKHEGGMYDNAETDYKAALAAIDTKDVKTKATVFMNLGFLYADKNMPELAYDNFLKATVLDPKNPRVHYELGKHLSKSEFRGELKKALGSKLDNTALKAFRNATKLDKKYVKAYEGSAMVWFRLGKYRVALNILNKCLDIDKHNADTLLLRSKVHDKLGNYGSASKDRMDAFRINPSLREQK